MDSSDSKYERALFGGKVFLDQNAHVCITDEAELEDPRDGTMESLPLEALVDEFLEVRLDADSPVEDQREADAVIAAFERCVGKLVRGREELRLRGLGQNEKER